MRNGRVAKEYDLTIFQLNRDIGGPKNCINYIITIKEITKNRRGKKTHKNDDYITTINKGDYKNSD